MSAFLRKYGTGTGADVYIPMVTAGATDTNPTWTPAAGDVKVSKDGGAAANIGTLPTSVTMGNSKTWKFVFTDAELQCKVLAVTVSDTATKAVEDTQFNVETYGHASALHPFDLATATQSVNVTQINSNSNAAARLALTAAQMVPGTVDTGSFTPTTTQFEADDITEATADHYNGRIIVWTSGALAGQATSISDYVLSGANGKFTVVAMTEAPANNDTFIIV